MSTAISKRNRNDITFMTFFCVICTLLNTIGSMIAVKTGIPFYLDSVGTFLSAACGGYVPGVIVAFATTLIKAITDPEAMYYNVVGMLMAVCCAFFARKGFFQKKALPFLTIPVYALVAGIPDTILTWFLYTADAADQYTGLEKLLRDDAGMSAFPAKLIVEILTEFADKGITLTAAVIILWLLPKGIRNKIKPNSLWQSPLTGDMKKAIKKSHSRSVSLRVKVVLILTAATIIIAGTATVISSILFKDTNTKDKKTLANGVAELAASYIDPEKVDSFLEDGEASEDYINTEKMLYTLKDTYPDVEYLYVYRIEPDGCHVVFDLDTEEVEGSSPGEVQPFDESFSELIPSLLAGETIDPIISDDSYGWLLTVYKPVYDAQGKCVCYAAVDISMEDISVYSNRFMVKLISLVLGFFVLIIAVCTWVVKHNILIPVNTMAYCAEKFAFDNTEAIEHSVERMRSLDIRTGDEIENLYLAFVKTIGDSMTYVSDIKTKTETISRMQNGLIMVLADMVESCDKCTGDHVRKTSAYVKLIMEKMKEKHFYPEVLTDEFIHNVMNAAPLHDIGKIHISDIILNKPSRLTDEEFEVMKSHTTIGSEIIERAIEMVPDSGYLMEARNLSEFHHEKWNGKGYPHGISGEEIPLSARIMAVADVFDALVSRRSYKEPFTFEKAMDIIRQDAGVHFDPLVAEAFLGAEDEVRQIAEDFEKKSTLV
ncbi:MAG TPA: HD domain-containing protein [Ruminococcus sp.]|nr:HD domain-containing protein [Ruminococcus sp.]